MEVESEKNNMSEYSETAQMEAPAEKKSTDNVNSPSELSEPIWSVVTYETVAASNLSYDEAKDLAEKLKNERVSGLCIVTDEAARKLAN